MAINKPLLVNGRHYAYFFLLRIAVRNQVLYTVKAVKIKNCYMESTWAQCLRQPQLTESFYIMPSDSLLFSQNYSFKAESILHS